MVGSAASERNRPPQFGQTSRAHTSEGVSTLSLIASHCPPSLPSSGTSCYNLLGDHHHGAP